MRVLPRHSGNAWLLLLSFFLLNCGVTPLSLAADKLNTRLGDVKIIESPGSPRGAITVNGLVVFDSDAQYVSFYDHVDTAEGVVILFGVNPGGSATPISNFYFLLLKAGEKSQVVTTKGFDSYHAAKITSNGDEILVELAFDAKRKKQAKLQGNKVIVEYSQVSPLLSMSEEDCKWLHKYSAQECIDDNRKSKIDCEKYAHNYSGYSTVVMTGITTLSNHPGFNATALEDACLRECKIGAEVSFSEFKRDVCSIQ
ncbi:hypothetical protein [uncultured Desulfobulbus sp.]|uniref:hypothetical protein n=1 Tax=uncultured Desulfobulbus sp. TaxID=239745 RepID=UPI0029C755D0|nr:hypothetical protein [uncultured Desulfobulbus sp.]